MYNQLNKTLYISAIVFLLSASVFVACKSKEEKAIEETSEAISEIPIETTTSSDWKSYKESANATIANNEARIQTLKEKIKASNTPNIDKLRQKRINELEDRNTALRAKIMEYKEENTTIDLAQLKADIQKELDDLEKALKELDEK
jgi:hypothetical protein